MNIEKAKLSGFYIPMNSAIGSWLVEPIAHSWDVCINWFLCISKIKSCPTKQSQLKWNQELKMSIWNKEMLHMTIGKKFSTQSRFGKKVIRELLLNFSWLDLTLVFAETCQSPQSWLSFSIFHWTFWPIKKLEWYPLRVWEDWESFSCHVLHESKRRKNTYWTRIKKKGSKVVFESTKMAQETYFPFYWNRWRDDVTMLGVLWCWMFRSLQFVIGGSLNWLDVKDKTSKMNKSRSHNGSIAFQATLN